MQEMWICFMGANGGRFANQMFAYLAAKIISHLCGHEILDSRPEGPAVIYTDWMWIDFENKFLQDNTYRDPAFQSNIAFYGYFQRSRILNHFREYLKSHLVPDNNEIIAWCPEYRAHQIVPDESTRTFGSDELVIHLRLDDFIRQGEAAHPRVYLEQIKKVSEERPIRKYIIICEPTRSPIEVAYLEHFKELEPEIISTDRLEDFKALQNAKVMICSNSTYSWLAAFFGNVERLLIARETIHSAPYLAEIGSNSETFTITERYKA
jgi:hypothetical protein